MSSVDGEDGYGLLCFPHELLLHILHYLEPLDLLLTCSVINKHFYTLAGCSSLWESAIIHEGRRGCFADNVGVLFRKKAHSDVERGGNSAEEDEGGVWKRGYVQKVKCMRNWREGKYKVDSIHAHQSPIRAISYDPSTMSPAFNDVIFITGSDDSTIKIWSLSTKRNLATFAAPTPVSCVQSANNTLISGSTADSGLIVHKIHEDYSAEMVAQYKGHKDLVTSMQFDSDKVISCSYDTTLKQWDMHTGDNIWDVIPSATFLWALQFTGNTLMLGASNRAIEMWDLRDQMRVNVFKGHKGSVYCLQFDSNSHTLVSGSGDDTIRVFDTRNSKTHLAVLSGHSNCVDTIHCIGDRLVSGSRDKSLKVWDLKTFALLYDMREHTGSVWGLRTDVQYCVSVGDDRTVKIWDFGEREKQEEEE